MSNTYLYDFNSTFFLSVGTLIITGMGVCLGYALKSKCNNVKLCCGCIEIERDVKLEADIEEHTNQQQVTTTIDTIPNSQQPSRRSSARCSYNLSTEAIKALNTISTKEETKEIDFGKSMI